MDFPPDFTSGVVSLPVILKWLQGRKREATKSVSLRPLLHAASDGEMAAFEYNCHT